MCLYPKLILNPKYKSTKKNGGNIPTLKDPRVKYVPIGCQQCMECKKQKATTWRTRLHEEIKHRKNAKFITLTFNDKSYAELRNAIEIKTDDEYLIDNQIATLAVRRFLERHRKKNKRALRHWLITEIGGNNTERIHLHGIIWTDDLNELEQLWKYGQIWKGKKQYNHLSRRIENVNYVNARTVSYITKYVTKIDFKHRTYKAIILTSPGIGAKYTETLTSKENKFNGKKTNETYRTSTGHKIALPIYWRNKIYTDEQREELWIYKIEKNIRFIGREKIDISKGYEEYDKTLKWYQLKNIQLGYGTDEKNWTLEQYEQQRRKLLNEKKIKNAFGGKYSKGYGYIRET